MRVEIFDRCTSSAPSSAHELYIVDDGLVQRRMPATAYGKPTYVSPNHHLQFSRNGIVTNAAVEDLVQHCASTWANAQVLGEYGLVIAASRPLDAEPLPVHELEMIFAAPDSSSPSV